jgi:hypothetical protein
MLQLFVLGVVAISAGAGATWLIAISLSQEAIAASVEAGRFAGLGEESEQPHRARGRRREVRAIAQPRRHAGLVKRVREMSFRSARVRSVQCMRRA